MQKDIADGAAAVAGLHLVVMAIALPVAAWITHLVVCFQTGAWGFLIAGAIFFPIGMIHGGGTWFGWW